MKNNQLHHFIHDLHQAEQADLPQFEQRLRRSVLNSNRNMGVATKVKQLFSFKKDPFMRTRRTFVGMSSFALLLVFVLSFFTYTYRFSPKAAAEQVINNGLVSIEAAAPAQLAQLQSQLGDDPAAALKEAKAAKDVTVITKAEYVSLSKNSAGVLATSLSNDPNSPKTTSVSISGGDNKGVAAAYGTVIVGANEAGASSGGSDSGTTYVATGSGTISSSPAPATGAGVSYSTATTAPGAPGSTPPSPPDASGTFNTSVSATAGTTGAAFYATTGTSSTPAAGPTTQVTAIDGKTMPAPTPAMLKAMQEFKPVEPSKYLKYTDSHGRTVVLSLDAKGLPIFKTIFMTTKEAQNLHP